MLTDCHELKKEGEKEKNSTVFLFEMFKVGVTGCVCMYVCIHEY